MRCFVAALVAVGVLTVGAAPAAAEFDQTFTNSTAINGPTGGAYGFAYPWGSEIKVAGATGMLQQVEVTLNGVTTTSTSDLDVMLESPEGRTTMLMSDVGGPYDLSNKTLRIASGRSPMSSSALTGSEYAPTNISTPACGGRSNDDDFLSPSPGTPTGSPTFGTFDRSAVNGTWKLWVMDDCEGDAVAITGGWSLRVTTYSNIRVPGTGSAGPAATYPIDVPITGQGTRVTKVVASLDALNHSEGQDLDVLLVGPTGASTLLMSDALSGRVEHVDSPITFDDDGPNVPVISRGPAFTTGTFRPTDYGGSNPDAFPAPAPPGPWGTTLGTFAGTNPNGVWKFYIVDDGSGDVGGLDFVTLKITSVTPGGLPVVTTQTANAASSSTGSTKDRAAPKAVVSTKALTLPKVLKAGGFDVVVSTNEAASLASSASMAASKAKTSAAAVVAKGSATARKAGRVRMKLKLTRKGRRALAKRRRASTLKLTTRVTDRSGNRRLVKRTLKLKRR